MNNSEAILKYAFCYSMIFILTWVSKRNKSNRLFDSNGKPAANSAQLIGLHLAGILWLGLVPLIFFGQSLKTIVRSNSPLSFSWLLSFVLILAAISFAGFWGSRRIYVKCESQPALSNKFLILYFPVRLLFVCSYELFFRGILLFDCIEWFGILPAVIISTTLTVLIHVFTNKKEMWACIPFGIMLSACCISIHAVWPAVILHLSLSLFYEMPPVIQFLTRLKLSK